MQQGEIDARMRYFAEILFTSWLLPVLCALPSPLSYCRIRLQWCGSVLRGLLKQWLVYVVVGLALLGGFSAGATSSMAALMAWSVLALFQAASHGVAEGLVVAALHSLVGALLTLALRPVMWPATWAQAERALPLSWRDRVVTDACVVALGLLPLFAVYVVGAVSWLATSPAWLQGARWSAVLMLLVSMLLSHAAGVLVLHHMRRPARQAAPDRGEALVKPRHIAVRRQHPGWPLLWWPMVRGPAQRTGRWAMGLTGLLVIVEVSMSCAQWRVADVNGATWCLAAWSLLSLAGTSRLQALIQRELAPLHEACAPLPLSLKRWLWLRRALALLPLLVGLLGLPLAWWHSTPDVRPAVAGLFVVVSLLGHAWQLLGDQPGSQTQVVRWVLTLVVLTALASEVFAP
jgi:hypothetical protein